MILYITRKYRPSVGGMEELNYHLLEAMSAQTEVRAIVWGGSQVWLPVFAGWAFLRGLAYLVRGQVQAIHLGDAVLSPLGITLRFLTRTPTFATAAGLDVTFANRFYQTVIPACLRRLDGIVCISGYTRSQCLLRGVEAARCVVIHPGVAVPSSSELTACDHNALELASGLSLHGRKIILAVGRMVKRKGVAWFANEVLPAILERTPQAALLVIGEGPDRSALQTLVTSRGLTGSVRLLGRVDTTILGTAYACADLLVMPNVLIPNDPEGFGLVSLEARSFGTPVVASDLQGVGDSIRHGVDGLLVPAGDASAFASAVTAVLDGSAKLLPRDELRARMAASADWPAVASQYLRQFQEWLPMPAHDRGEVR